MLSAYYSNSLECWVRLEKQKDGEYCHTSGFATREEALGQPKVMIKWESWLSD